MLAILTMLTPLRALRVAPGCSAPPIPCVVRDGRLEVSGRGASSYCSAATGGQNKGQPIFGCTMVARQSQNLLTSREYRLRDHALVNNPPWRSLEARSSGTNACESLSTNLTGVPMVSQQPHGS